MWEREGTTPCLKTCPSSEGGCLSGKLENGRAVRTFYDAARCNTRVHTHWVGGFQKVLEETLNESDRDKRKMLLYGDFFTRSLWAITYSSTNIAQCFECMRVCPSAHGVREMKRTRSHQRLQQATLGTQRAHGPRYNDGLQARSRGLQALQGRGAQALQLVPEDRPARPVGQADRRAARAR